jgi:sulfur-oxidizing protein SoxX
MKTVSLFIALVCGVFLLGACVADKDSPRGFSLPEGNAETGRTTFTALQCNACHYTSDIEQQASTVEKGVSVFLGGEVATVKTYADLVTSIINPSHRIAAGYPTDMVTDGDKSKMRNYNKVMTVEELVNLVSYLQPQYQLLVHQPRMYRRYYYTH